MSTQQLHKNSSLAKIPAHESYLHPHVARDAEQFEDSWPHPDYFAAIVTAIVALPLIGYGVALAVFGAPDETLLCSLFIGGPFILMVAAILAITLEAQQAKKRAVAEKRSDYERWSATEQSFSFDQQNWTHEAEGGKLESPWSALLVAIERKNAFSLRAEKGSMTVPKRVFESASLTSLRQYALPVRGNGWEFGFSFRDHQAAQTALLWHKRGFAMVFANSLGVVVLGWIMKSWIAEIGKPVMIWGWILAAAATLFALTAQLWYLPLKYVTWPRHLKEPMTVEFSNSGVYCATQRKKTSSSPGRRSRNSTRLGAPFSSTLILPITICYRSATFRLNGRPKSARPCRKGLSRNDRDAGTF